MGILDIFSRRMKYERGEMPDVYTYDKFPRECKVQIVQVWTATLGRGVFLDHRGNIYDDIVVELRKERGVFSLTEASWQLREKNPARELADYFLALPGDGLVNVEHALDVVEMVFGTIHWLMNTSDFPYHNIPDFFSSYNGASQDFGDAIEELNGRFRQHGMGYQLESSRVVRVDYAFAHSVIVKPVLQQLVSDEKFDGPNQLFLKAHEHYRHGEYKSCLSECYNAFESTMKVICGECDWTYEGTAAAKKLINVCLDRGLLPSFTEQQLHATRLILESGAPTVRNNLAGHGQESPEPIPQHLASFALHSTAANILLLIQAYKALPLTEEIARSCPTDCDRTRAR